jgi:hypothetical protein
VCSKIKQKSTYNGDRLNNVFFEVPFCNDRCNKTIGFQLAPGWRKDTWLLSLSPYRMCSSEGFLSWVLGEESSLASFLSASWSGFLSSGISERNYDRRSFRSFLIVRSSKSPKSCLSLGSSSPFSRASLSISDSFSRVWCHSSLVIIVSLLLLRCRNHVSEIYSWTDRNIVKKKKGPDV